MKRAEQITCFFWLALSGSVCLGSLNLKLGTPSEPGSGFLPFGIGLLLGVLSLAHLFHITLWQSGEEKAEPFLGNIQGNRALCVVASLLLYALLLTHLGYILTTFLLMLVLFSTYERKKWWLVLTLSLVVIGVTYLVFHHWLKVQFPPEFFRIG